MASLFSHAHEPDYVAPQASAVAHLSAVIDVPLDHAFDGFTDGIHLWWPVAEQSVFGEGSHIAILRDHLVEESEDGDEVIWADVVEWEAPQQIKLHWVLGQQQDGGSDVEIHFETVEGGASRVSVRYEQCSGETYDSGDSFTCDWSLIFSRYARFMGGALQLD